MISANQAWRRQTEEARATREAANLERQIKCNEDHIAIKKDKTEKSHELDRARADNEAKRASDQLAWEKERYEKEQKVAEDLRNDQKAALQEKLKLF